MDGSIRVSAKTVDDAITEALIQLGVTSDRLEYEVIRKRQLRFSWNRNEAGSDRSPQKTGTCGRSERRDNTG